MAVQTVQKFLFDTSFDQTQARPAPAPAKPKPQEPRYGEADLAAAREQGFEAGRVAAAAEAQASIERTAASALEAIGRAMSTLIEAQSAADQAAIRTAVETAVAIARRLHPELARRHGLVEVEAILRRCLEARREEPRLLVRVADGLLDALGARMETLTRSTGFEGRVVLLADDSIAPGDCRVEWADGGVERDSAVLWSEIEAAVGRALAAPPCDAAAPDPTRAGDEQGREATDERTD